MFLWTVTLLHFTISLASLWTALTFSSGLLGWILVCLWSATDPIGSHAWFFSSVLFAPSEFLLGPAIPSVTARSGAIFLPIIRSLAETCGSFPNDGTERVLGAYLMLTCFQTAAVTCSTFLTASHPNPLSAALAKSLINEVSSFLRTAFIARLSQQFLHFRKVHPLCQHMWWLIPRRAFLPLSKILSVLAQLVSESRWRGSSREHLSLTHRDVKDIVSMLWTWCSFVPNFLKITVFYAVMAYVTAFLCWHTEDCIYSG